MGDVFHSDVSILYYPEINGKELWSSISSEENIERKRC